MDKLLFYARNDILSSQSSTGKKVLREYKALSKMFDTYLISQSNNKILITHNGSSTVLKELKNRNGMLFAFNHSAVEMVKKIKCRYVYIRYPKSNPVFLSFLKTIHTNGCRTIIEFPTYPYDLEIKTYGRGFRNKIIFYIDRLFRYLLKKYVYAAATFSDDKEIFGIPAFKIVNGIDFDEVEPLTSSVVSGDEINIIAVAEMQRAHAYDRFIIGLGDYYRSNPIQKVNLHLVGTGPCKEDYQNLTKLLNLEQYVIFHGYCIGSELDMIYKKCTLGLEILGGHRTGIKLSSSLKSREYLSKGLPMISSIKIDILPEKFPYVLMVPDDESRLDIKKIVEYHTRIYEKGRYKVAKSIYDYAKNKCDMRIVLKPILEKFYE